MKPSEDGMESDESHGTKSVSEDIECVEWMVRLVEIGTLLLSAECEREEFVHNVPEATC